MNVLLGIDVGTSASKAVLVDTQGVVLGVASAAHPISSPRAGWSEQNPEDWWSSVLQATRSVLRASGLNARDVLAIGLSGQMHGSVFLARSSARGWGRDAPALRPALLWNDQRTAAQCEAIERSAGGRRALVERVGNAALTGFTLPKILWLREHEPDVFALVSSILLPKDYIRLRLTGRLVTDVGDASGTLLFDVAARRWSADAFARHGLESSLFPRVMESAEVSGLLTPWAARELGLVADLPVVAGSGDNMAGAIGAGVAEPGVALATLGTSGVIYAHTDSPRFDLAEHTPGRFHGMCSGNGSSAVRGGWCMTGCMLAAAGCLQWCRDALFPGVGFYELMREASDAPPGCEGLVFLPHLTGERCPHADPLARGGWIGLTSRHQRAHLVRAVIEGVTFGMGQILDLFRGAGVTPDRIRLGGGGAKSAFWRQLQADVYGTPVELPNTEEGPAFGAALMAGVGHGVWPSVAVACRSVVRTTETRDPAPRNTLGPLLRAREVYESLYGDLKDRFAALARVSGP